MTEPRIAFFTDSYLEVNGVARTSREFARFARETNRPFLSVHTGAETRHWQEGTLSTYELQNSRFLIPLETDLSFDLLFLRHRAWLQRALRRFQPDLIHITGPGHVGMLGALLAWQMNIPLVASWHTNVHEFGGRRLQKVLRFLPRPVRVAAGDLLQQVTLAAVLWFYCSGRVLFAPNPELIYMLRSRSGRPTYLMQRGIDLDLFSPAHRARTDDEFVIGYVGRLSPEKNVRLLAEVERLLLARGVTRYRFLIVGDGADRSWLARTLRRVELPGVLHGAALARAYANMDAFLFPSETDTFGNVVLEALASGLPTVVSAGGGPKYIIRPGIDGFAAGTAEAFADRLAELYWHPDLRRQMGRNARGSASRFSWNRVFEEIYGHYEEVLSSADLPSVAEPEEVSLSMSL